MNSREGAEPNTESAEGINGNVAKTESMEVDVDGNTINPVDDPLNTVEGNRVIPARIVPDGYGNIKPNEIKLPDDFGNE